MKAVVVTTTIGAGMANTEYMMSLSFLLIVVGLIASMTGIDSINILRGPITADAQCDIRSRYMITLHSTLLEGASA